MKILSSYKTKKFSISGISATDMRNLYQSLSDEKFKAAIRQALIDAEDPDEINNEFGYGVEEYIDNFLS